MAKPIQYCKVKKFKKKSCYIAKLKKKKKKSTQYCKAIILQLKIKILNLVKKKKRNEKKHQTQFWTHWNELVNTGSCVSVHIRSQMRGERFDVHIWELSALKKIVETVEPYEILVGLKGTGWNMFYTPLPFSGLYCYQHPRQKYAWLWPLFHLPIWFFPFWTIN